MQNTLITISDNKIGTDTNADNLADFYTASVLSATDYYAFGMSMSGRSWQSEKYRYGFNGQERDRDIREDGNHTTAEFWEYSAVVGRRWNIDPVVNPSIGSYTVNEGNPILMNDPDGDIAVCPKCPVQKKINDNILQPIKNGVEQFINKIQDIKSSISQANSNFWNATGNKLAEWDRKSKDVKYNMKKSITGGYAVSIGATAAIGTLGGSIAGGIVADRNEGGLFITTSHVASASFALSVDFSITAILANKSVPFDIHQNWAGNSDTYGASAGNFGLSMSGDKQTMSTSPNNLKAGESYDINGLFTNRNYTAFTTTYSLGSKVVSSLPSPSIRGTSVGANISFYNKTIVFGSGLFNR